MSNQNHDLIMKLKDSMQRELELRSFKYLLFNAHILFYIFVYVCMHVCTLRLYLYIFQYRLYLCALLSAIVMCRINADAVNECNILMYR